MPQRLIALGRWGGSRGGTDAERGTRRSWRSVALSAGFIRQVGLIQEFYFMCLSYGIVMT